MRYIKIVTAVFLFILPLPEQALANLAPLTPPANITWQLLLIFPLIIIFTEVGGGYPILKSIRNDSWMRHIKFLTGKGGPIIAVFAVYSVAIFGQVGPIVFLIFFVYAFVRGIRMIRWGSVAGGKSRAAELHMENAKPWRLKLGGWLLIVFTLLLIIVPLAFYTPHYPPRSYDRDAKSNLHNVWLGCKAYWADNGSSVNCTVDIIRTTTYGYVQSSGIVITASGDEPHFSAKASHIFGGGTFAVDANGSVTKSKDSLLKEPPKESEKGWADNAVGNIKANLSDLGF